MKTPTIYEIKELVVNSPFLFSRKSMKTFNQTLKDFHVNKTLCEYVFYLYAPSFNNNLTERWFNSQNNKIYHSYESAIKGE